MEVNQQTQDNEQALLGAMLTDPTIIASIVAVVSRADFQEVRHALIFDAVKRQGELTDLLTIETDLKNTKPASKLFVDALEECGGAAYLAELTICVPTALNAMAYAHNVRHAAQKRRLIAFAGEIATMASRATLDEAEELQARAMAMLTASAGETLSGGVGAKKAVDSAVQSIERIFQNDGKDPDAISTGLLTLDRLTGGGWHKGQYITLAATTGGGKTTLATQFALNAAYWKKKTAIFSFEIAKEGIAKKWLSYISEVNLSYSRAKNFTNDEMTKVYNAANKMTKLDDYLQVYDNESANIEAIIAQCSALKARNGLDFVIVDYLGLIDFEIQRGQTESSAIGAVTRALKSMARRLDIAVLVLAQFIKAREEKGKPSKSDLFGSGRIAQDSDVILFLYQEPDTLSNERYLTIDKQREGVTGIEIKLQADFSASRLDETDDQPRLPQAYQVNK